MKPRGLRRGNWLVTELERLRTLLPRRGVEDTAKLLRRSVDSVTRKAVSLLRQPARRGPWTRSDDERLRESWGVLEPRLLGLLLGRPTAEVVRRASELAADLRDGPWTQQERHRLKDCFGTRSEEALQVVIGRPIAEILEQARQQCLAKDKRFAARRQRAQQQVSPASGSRPGSAGKMPRWTPVQVAELVRIYADRDNLTVAKALGRSVNSVANKAYQLGLKKSPGLLADIGRSNVAARYSPEVPAVVPHGRAAARASSRAPQRPAGAASQAGT